MSSRINIPEEELEKLFKTPLGDTVYIYGDSMVVELSGNRTVVSSSNLNGGARRDLRYLFNYSYCHCKEVVYKLEPDMSHFNIIEHYTEIAKNLGLPVEQTTGMGTAARIENSAFSLMEKHGVRVYTIATAGIDVNGGCAGDPAAYDEFTNEDLVVPGTVNIMLFIDAKMDDGALTRAMITATEAKTASLRELMASSNYSKELATGSGTDSVVVVGNNASSVTLYNSGKHVLLGEMIGKSVKSAVKEALSLQTGMSPKRQMSLLWQGKRYGITVKSIKDICDSIADLQGEAKVLSDDAIEEICKDANFATPLLALLHLCDQYRWGIVPLEALKETAKAIFLSIDDKYHRGSMGIEWETDHLPLDEQVVLHIKKAIVRAVKDRRVQD